MASASKGLNLAPFMAVAFGLMVVGSWCEARTRVDTRFLLGGDIAVAIGLVLLIFRVVRGPEINHGSVHRLLRPWLVLTLVGASVFWVVVVWRCVTELLRGG